MRAGRDWPLSALLVTSCALLVTSQPAGGDYLVGVGIGDMTGPAAEIGMMGYANLKQKTAGIHLRQFSRAYVIDDGDSRMAFVSADVGMIPHGIRKQVSYPQSYNVSAIFTCELLQGHSLTDRYINENRRKLVRFGRAQTLGHHILADVTTLLTW
uniref:Neutral ceramidase n=1 Tax=Timema tahoe TaxID=61484 RepID=A0A7R9FJA3_9NEOP|nr:unnamed protein product [Timema tahoe]